MVPDSFIFYTLYYTSYYFPRLSDSIQLFNPSNANPKNGQTYSNNSSAFADELFEFVSPFCGVGA